MKALSLGNGQFSGKTLSVSSQDLNTKANTPGLRVRGVTLEMVDKRLKIYNLCYVMLYHALIT